MGCGYWGMNYVRVFSELPDTRVVCVCDQRPERLEEISSRFPGIFLTPQLDSALRHDGVDAVIVCTNATTHYNVTHRALMAGKHVLVEKPLTTVSAEAEQLIELAAAKSVVLMVGHTFVYNAGIHKMKEYIEAGRDQVYYLYSSRTNLGPIRTDVNALWDLAPHDIAIFNYLLDSTPHWVSAVGLKVLRNCREDVGFISLGYPGDRTDIVGHIHVSWADPHKARELVVVGSDRRVVFNDLNGVEQVRVFEKGIKATSDRTGDLWRVSAPDSRRRHRQPQARSERTAQEPMPALPGVRHFRRGADYKPRATGSKWSGYSKPSIAH